MSVFEHDGCNYQEIHCKACGRISVHAMDGTCLESWMTPVAHERMRMIDAGFEWNDCYNKWIPLEAAA